MNENYTSAFELGKRINGLPHKLRQVVLAIVQFDDLTMYDGEEREYYNKLILDIIKDELET